MNNLTDDEWSLLLTRINFRFRDIFKPHSGVKMLMYRMLATGASQANISSSLNVNQKYDEIFT